MISALINVIKAVGLILYRCMSIGNIIIPNQKTLSAVNNKPISSYYDTPAGATNTWAGHTPKEQVLDFYYGLSPYLHQVAPATQVVRKWVALVANFIYNIDNFLEYVYVKLFQLVNLQTAYKNDTLARMLHWGQMFGLFLCIIAGIIYFGMIILSPKAGLTSKFKVFVRNTILVGALFGIIPTVSNAFTKGLTYEAQNMIGSNRDFGGPGKKVGTMTDDIFKYNVYSVPHKVDTVERTGSNTITVPDGEKTRYLPKTTFYKTKYNPAVSGIRYYDNGGHLNRQNGKGAGFPIHAKQIIVNLSQMSDKERDSWNGLDETGVPSFLNDYESMDSIQSPNQATTKTKNKVKSNQSQDKQSADSIIALWESNGKAGKEFRKIKDPSNPLPALPQNLTEDLQKYVDNENDANKDNIARQDSSKWRLVQGIENSFDGDASGIRKGRGSYDMAKIEINFRKYYRGLNAKQKAAAKNTVTQLGNIEQDDIDGHSVNTKNSLGIFGYEIGGNDPTATIGDISSERTKGDGFVSKMFHDATQEPLTDWYDTYKVQWFNIFLALILFFLVMVAFIYKLISAAFKLIVMYMALAIFAYKSLSAPQVWKEFIHAFVGIYVALMFDIIMIRLWMTCYFIFGGIIQNIVYDSPYPSNIVAGLLQVVMGFALFKVAISGINILDKMMGTGATSGAQRSWGNALATVAGLRSAYSIGKGTVGFAGRAGAAPFSAGGKALNGFQNHHNRMKSRRNATGENWVRRGADKAGNIASKANPKGWLQQAKNGKERFKDGFRKHPQNHISGSADTPKAKQEAKARQKLANSAKQDKDGNKDKGASISADKAFSGGFDNDKSGKHGNKQNGKRTPSSKGAINRKGADESKASQAKANGKNSKGRLNKNGKHNKGNNHFGGSSALGTTGNDVSTTPSDASNSDNSTDNSSNDSGIPSDTDSDTSADDGFDTNSGNLDNDSDTTTGTNADNGTTGNLDSDSPVGTSGNDVDNDGGFNGLTNGENSSEAKVSGSNKSNGKSNNGKGNNNYHKSNGSNHKFQPKPQQHKGIAGTAGNGMQHIGNGILKATGNRGLATPVQPNAPVTPSSNATSSSNSSKAKPASNAFTGQTQSSNSHSSNSSNSNNPFTGTTSHLSGNHNPSDNGGNGNLDSDSQINGTGTNPVSDAFGGDTDGFNTTDTPSDNTTNGTTGNNDTATTPTQSNNASNSAKGSGTASVDNPNQISPDSNAETTDATVKGNNDTANNGVNSPQQQAHQVKQQAHVQTKHANNNVATGNSTPTPTTGHQTNGATATTTTGTNSHLNGNTPATTGTNPVSSTGNLNNNSGDNTTGTNPTTTPNISNNDNAGQVSGQSLGHNNSQPNNTHSTINANQTAHTNSSTANPSNTNANTTAGQSGTHTIDRNVNRNVVNTNHIKNSGNNLSNDTSNGSQKTVVHNHVNNHIVGHNIDDNATGTTPTSTNIPNNNLTTTTDTNTTHSNDNTTGSNPITHTEVGNNSNNTTTVNHHVNQNVNTTSDLTGTNPTTTGNDATGTTQTINTNDNVNTGNNQTVNNGSTGTIPSSNTGTNHVVTTNHVNTTHHNIGSNNIGTSGTNPVGNSNTIHTTNTINTDSGTGSLHDVFNQAINNSGNIPTGNTKTVNHINHINTTTGNNVIDNAVGTQPSSNINVNHHSNQPNNEQTNNVNGTTGNNSEGITGGLFRDMLGGEDNSNNNGASNGTGSNDRLDNIVNDNHDSNNPDFAKMFHDDSEDDNGNPDHFSH